MAYIPLHFDPCELLPGVSRDADWATLRPEIRARLDDRLLETADDIRGILGVPCSANDYAFGGTRSACGWRRPDCPIGAPNSYHKRGQAVDLHPDGMTAEEARGKVRAAIAAGKPPMSEASNSASPGSMLTFGHDGPGKCCGSAHEKDSPPRVETPLLVLVRPAPMGDHSARRGVGDGPWPILLPTVVERPGAGRVRSPGQGRPEPGACRVKTYAALILSGLIGSVLVVAVGLLVGSLYVVQVHGLAWAVEQGYAIFEGVAR